MSLVCLAQYSGDGVREAQLIIDELRLADARNPSAFVAQGVEHARRRLNPGGNAAYAGMTPLGQAHR